MHTVSESEPVESVETPRRARIPQKLFRPPDPIPTTTHLIDRNRVLKALAAWEIIDRPDIEFLAEHGQSYAGVPLPLGVRRWPFGKCFVAAQSLHDCSQGSFVLGFALRPYGTALGNAPLPHAWVTQTGGDAIDAVWWEDVERCNYFGIKGREHEDRLLRMFSIAHKRLGLETPHERLGIDTSMKWRWW